jgi:hypothetical protein
VPPEPFSGRRYHDHAATCPAGSNPCALCGKPIAERPENLFAHVVDGGGRFLRLDEEPAHVEDGGEMGCWPIGGDCARRFPPGYLATAAERRGVDCGHVWSCECITADRYPVCVTHPMRCTRCGAVAPL